MACVFLLIRIICLVHMFLQCSGGSSDIDNAYGKDDDHRLVARDADYEDEDDAYGNDDDDDNDDDDYDDDYDDYYDDEEEEEEDRHG